MKYTLLALSILFSSQAVANGTYDDWRKSSATKEKINNLVKVIPSTSDIMFQMGERYKNFYWAAKQGKWEFAEYQMEEMQSLIRTLTITRPKRKATAENLRPACFSKPRMKWTSI